MRVYALALSAFLAAGTAFAQESLDPPPGGMLGRMDTNRDGAISREEFLNGHMRADAYFSKLDANKDGAVSREEFLAEPAGTKRSERFKHLDTNGDGRITREEIDAQRTARFDMLDTNRDGTLSPDEIKAAHAALKRQKPGAKPEGAPAQ